MFNNQIVSALKKRRSIYQLGRSVTTPTNDIVKIAQDAIIESPTAFNGQTVKAIFLFDEHHEHLWDLTAERLRSEVPSDEAYQATLKKLNSFKAAFGTILFFEDSATVRQEEKDYPLYRDNFQDWAEQAQGGAQQAVWVALALNNIGASLQHYNPLIDEQVREAFAVPAEWVLRAEMPFGSIEAPAGEKSYLPREERFVVFQHKAV
ncbi:nitroreductase family protein [Lacticaseibacillus zeae]|uniref:Nitroreductase family protein n=3 Tax=Lacticaseibacillus zeae TaxID=57037 RepID=A0A5R8LR78_LACZE|nr:MULTISPECIES: nitroreductase family protein [Lacticaseibacillus]OFR91632.1 nitroreductase [Lactobacillus sp. HMSC068F07]OLS09017.1 nitroreductase [Lacticaseibacillus casei]KRK10594.1 nitroreductase family protein [Lacticaseibacillus zeae DSM 20178 = KCTC 3804]MDE3316437.1 nitroreductase family protein [Lacticaseibacillus zeae]QVI32307.1 nitroreductase family protein [Lacticaseibacillus zeae]